MRYNVYNWSSTPYQARSKGFTYIGADDGFISNAKPVCETCRIIMSYLEDKELWICNNCGQTLAGLTWKDRQRKMIQKQARLLANTVKFDDGTTPGSDEKQVVLQKQMRHEDSRRKARRKFSEADKELIDMGFNVVESHEILR